MVPQADGTRLDDPKRQGLLRHAIYGLRGSDLLGRILAEKPLIAHDYTTLVGAAIEGVGLAQAPGTLVRQPIDDGRLQMLLSPFAVTTPGVFLYYPDKRQVLPNCAHSSSRSGAAPAGGMTVRT